MANKYPPSAEEISVRDMSKSAFGRELYNAILNLTAKVSRIEENQRIQEERAERDHRSIIDFGNSLVDLRQKTDAITEKLETVSQAVAELRAVTVSAEKEKKSLSAEVMRIQESLNGIIETTSEMKRKQDLYAMKVREDKRKFEKFIGRWKLVKWEMNGVERNISHWPYQSDSFEPVPEGVMWKRYRKDGSERCSFILTTDEEIKNILRNEGKDCDLVESQSDGSFKWRGEKFNVEGNHLIERWRGDVLTYEKC